MREIIKRKNMEDKNIVNMKFQENYNVSGWFKKKKLAYCFYFIPEFHLYQDVYGGNMSMFNPNTMEDLLTSQVDLLFN